jgi:hypothetical protein
MLSVCGLFFAINNLNKGYRSACPQYAKECHIFWNSCLLFCEQGA